MKLSKQIKPISYLKARSAEILHELSEGGEPYIITQNGEAKAVLQDIKSYEKTQETLALLRILEIGKREIEQGKYKPADEVFARLRRKIRSKAQ